MTASAVFAGLLVDGNGASERLRERVATTFANSLAKETVLLGKVRYSPRPCHGRQRSSGRCVGSGNGASERGAARERVATVFESSLAKGTVLLSHSLRSPGYSSPGMRYGAVCRSRSCSTGAFWRGWQCGIRGPSG